MFRFGRRFLGWTLKIFTTVCKRDLSIPSGTVWSSWKKRTQRPKLSSFSLQFLGKGSRKFLPALAKLAYFPTYRKVWLSSARWPPWAKTGKKQNATALITRAADSQLTQWLTRITLIAINFVIAIKKLIAKNPRCNSCYLVIPRTVVTYKHKIVTSQLVVTVFFTVFSTHLNILKYF